MLLLPSSRTSAGRLVVLTALALCVGVSAGSRAWAAGCEVIDFSATKQRSQETIAGELVSTLVATPAAAPGDPVLLEADFGCVVGQGFDPVVTDNVITVEVLESAGGAFADRTSATSFESFGVPPANVAVSGCVDDACNGLRFIMPPSGLAGPARITVRRDGNVVARVFELAARTASCD